MWGEWGAWGPCDITVCRVEAGSSWRYRSRACEGAAAACEGPTRQADRCTAQDCPGTPPTGPSTGNSGTWGSWGAWSACSVTCGDGEQTRRRACWGGDQCPGKVVQVRACPGWDCPRCSPPCPAASSVWNEACTRCTCPGAALVTGRVTARSTRLPLADVAVSVAASPFDVLTRTNVSGGFVLQDVCPGQTLLFAAPHVYADTRERVVGDESDEPMEVTLIEIEPLTMAVQPVSKYRVSGEDVRLCCLATGQPPPRYYEWFKDDIIIHTEETSGQSSFLLKETNLSDSGSYRCRANNDQSAVYSDAATIEVKVESNQFCADAPEALEEDLPEGCVAADGSRTLDVGFCASLPCALEAENATTDGCVDEQHFCCGPTDTQLVLLHCDDGVPRARSQIKACGCRACLRLSTMAVFGQVRTVDGGRPIPWAQITVNKTIVAVVDTNGMFSFTIKRSNSRFGITVQDPASKFVSTTIVVSISDADEEEPLYVDVSLKQKAPAVVISSLRENILPIGNDDGESNIFADITLPENSMYTETGEKYEGTVKASVNYIDPRVPEDVLNAPSDFTFQDEEGEVQPLKTYGMFNLDFTDTVGNPLQASGQIEVVLDGTNIDMDTDASGDLLTRLWRLNQDTGRWEQAGKFVAEDGDSFRKRRRRKRQANPPNIVFVGTMNLMVSKWMNIDSLYSDRICYSKVRIFKDDRFNKLQQVERNQGTVRAYVLDRVGRGQASRQYALTDRHNNGYCIAHHCDIGQTTNRNEFKGYIQATVELKYFDGRNSSALKTSMSGINPSLAGRLNITAENNAFYTTFSTVLQNSRKGPLYYFNRGRKNPWMYSRECSRAGYDSDYNEFRFYVNEYDFNETCVPSVNYAVPKSEISNDVKPEYFRSWYSSNVRRFRNLNAEKEVCFIKIASTQKNTTPIKFRVSSIVGSASGKNVSRLDYGYVEGCMNSSAAICLEVKSPGPISDGVQEIAESPDIIIAPVGTTKHDCVSYTISDKFKTYMEESKLTYPSFNQTGNSFKLRLIYTKTTFKDGVYCVSAGDNRYERARLACLKGENPTYKDPRDPAEEITATYPLLKYHCPN